MLDLEPNEESLLKSGPDVPQLVAMNFERVSGGSNQQRSYVLIRKTEEKNHCRHLHSHTRTPESTPTIPYDMFG